MDFDLDHDKPILSADLAQVAGYGHYPFCIAKIQSSFSGDAALRGAPTGHTLTIREVRLAAGAEFIVVVCGDIMTMPGLLKVPAANGIDVDEAGRIKGLFEHEKINFQVLS